MNALPAPAARLDTWMHFEATGGEISALYRWAGPRGIPPRAAVRWFVVAGLARNGAVLPPGSLADARVAVFGDVGADEVPARLSGPLSGSPRSGCVCGAETGPPELAEPPAEDR